MADEINDQINFNSAVYFNRDWYQMLYCTLCMHTFLLFRPIALCMVHEPCTSRMFLGEYPLDKRNSKTNRRDTPGDICIRSIPLWFSYFTWLSRRFALSSWGLVMRICVTELCHHWFRQWLVGFRCQTIVRTNADMLPIGAEELEESPVKLEWKYGRFSRVWIWNVVCKMLLRPQCVD